MKITFLGTNGWYDTDTGNTICTLIQTKDFNIIIDAGNGIYKLDQYISGYSPTYLFIGHAHIDHIEGLHILNKFNSIPQMDLICSKEHETALKGLLRYPFTVEPKNLHMKLSIKGISEGEYDEPLPFTAKLLDHSGRTLGYRFVIEGKVVTYCSDTGICENDRLLAHNADLLIHECSYIDKKPGGWGHTSPEEAAELAVGSQVKRLILTHFAANLYTTFDLRDKAELTAKRLFPETLAATDGMVVKL